MVFHFLNHPPGLKNTHFYILLLMKSPWTPLFSPILYAVYKTGLTVIICDKDRSTTDRIGLVDKYLAFDSINFTSWERNRKEGWKKELAPTSTHLNPLIDCSFHGHRFKNILFFHKTRVNLNASIKFGNFTW